MPKNTKKFKADPVTTMGSFSKNLLGLKFMQRAKKEVEKVAAEKDESFNSSLCAKMKNKQQCIINPSYQFCERLRFGRFSFKGMNMDIENLMFKNKEEAESMKAPAVKRPAPPSENNSDNEIDNLDTDSDDSTRDDVDDEDDLEEDYLENL